MGAEILPAPRIAVIICALELPSTIHLTVLLENHLSPTEPFVPPARRFDSDHADQLLHARSIFEVEKPTVRQAQAVKERCGHFDLELAELKHSRLHIVLHVCPHLAVNCILYYIQSAARPCVPPSIYRAASSIRGSSICQRNAVIERIVCANCFFDIRKIRCALRVTCTRLYTVTCDDRNRRENRNDNNHDQELNDCKPLRWTFHTPTIA